VQRPEEPLAQMPDPAQYVVANRASGALTRS
jgi:hypothetical protein